MSRNPDDVMAGVARTRERISAAAARAGRDAADVEIVAAVKYLDADDLPLLHAAGITRVGENRTDQLVAKQAAYGDLFTWDFIGHLQSRKVKEIAGRVSLIHSLSTESTAQQIETRSPAPQEVLIEVNTAADPSKEGVAPDDLDAFLELLALTGLAIALPAYGLASRNTEVFINLRPAAINVVLLGIATLLVPPAVLLAVEWSVGRFAPRARRPLHAAFLAVLFALFAVRLLREGFHLCVVPNLALVVVTTAGFKIGRAHV